MAQTILLAFDVGEMLESQYESVRALFLVALRLHGQIQLIGQCQARQREMQAFGLFQRNAHVFDEMLDEK